MQSRTQIRPACAMTPAKTMRFQDLLKLTHPFLSSRLRGFEIDGAGSIRVTDATQRCRLRRPSQKTGEDKLRRAHKKTGEDKLRRQGAGLLGNGSCGERVMASGAATAGAAQEACARIVEEARLGQGAVQVAARQADIVELMIAHGLKMGNFPAVAAASDKPEQRGPEAAGGGEADGHAGSTGLIQRAHDLAFRRKNPKHRRAGKGSRLWRSGGGLNTGNAVFDAVLPLKGVKYLLISPTHVFNSNHQTFSWVCR